MAHDPESPARPEGPRVAAPQTPPNAPGRGLAPGARAGGASRRRLVALVAAALLVVAVAATATAVLVHVSRGGAAAAATHENGHITASNAELMGLVTLRRRVAPGFTLTDQHGRTVSLSQLDRHHVVVLGFMDDKCRDICPIVAQELVDAYHDLGARARSVDFVDVNVNAAHPAPATLRAFMDESGHGVATLPDFYYVTGSASALEQVWKDYGIKVVVNPKTGTVVHSDLMYFLAPGGAESYKATPFANMRKNGTGWLPAPMISQWGRGIAQYAAAAAK